MNLIQNVGETDRKYRATLRTVNPAPASISTETSANAASSSSSTAVYYNALFDVENPDGTLRIDTAFLQPEHGYPHHFYNATETGLRHWFRDFDIEWSGVDSYQHPQWSLSWFLGIYLDRVVAHTGESVAWPAASFQRLSICSRR